MNQESKNACIALNIQENSTSIVGTATNAQFVAETVEILDRIRERFPERKIKISVGYTVFPVLDVEIEPMETTARIAESVAVSKGGK